MNKEIATVFGVGYMPWAPGTWGSAIAIAFVWAAHGFLGFPGVVAIGGLVTFWGWYATEKYTKETGNHDPSEVVIDEVAGMFVALSPVSAGLWFSGADPWLLPWPGVVAAFVLFRIFDMWKPGPVGRADRRNDAWGVMLDDLVAGAIAAIGVVLLAVLSHLVLGS